MVLLTFEVDFPLRVTYMTASLCGGSGVLLVALLVAYVTRCAAQCTVTTLAGGFTSGTSSGSNDGIGTAALFNYPSGVTVSASGTVFVADLNNHKIRAITPDGTVTTLAGGSTSGTSLGSNDGVGTAALFRYPFGIAVSSSGTVFATDLNNQKVRAITPSGIVTTLAGGSTTGVLGGSNDGVGTAALLNGPLGVAVDASGTVIVADYYNHKVRSITPNGTVTTLAGGSTTGTESGLSDGVGTAARFYRPTGIAVSSSGTVFVADGNHKIRVITPNGAVTTLAGGSTTGALDGSNNGMGTAALFSLPDNVAVDAAGTVLVTDLNNHKLRAITPSGTVTTLAGGSTTGVFSGSNNGVGSAALFNFPRGVSVDASGTVFVADRDNNKIRVIYACPPGYFCPSGPCTTPQLCPAGHFCPAGSTAWNDKNCGRGNFCPWGSSEPTSCGPRGAIDSVRGPANGPAFAAEVAACRNHCYFGAPGQLSTCA